MQFHQGHGQRQAESHTLVVSRVAACDLTEGRNRLGHVLFGDADPGVRDREDQRPVPVNSRRYRDFAAFGGELDGVGDEVEQNLLDLGLVGAKRREIVRRLYRHLDAALQGLLGKETRRALARRRHIDLFLVQLQLAALGLRHLEDVGDDAEKMLAAVGDVGRIAEVAFVVHRAEHLVLHHFGESDDGVQGRAQFMAHVGEELAFGAAGLFRQIPRGPERLFALFQLRDVAHYGDRSPVLVGALAYLEPAPVPEIEFQRPLRGTVGVALDPCIEVAPGLAGDKRPESVGELDERRAGVEMGGYVGEINPQLVVAQHQPIVAAEQGEALRNIVDRGAQALLRPERAFAGLGLGGDVLRRATISLEGPGIVVEHRQAAQAEQPRLALAAGDLEGEVAEGRACRWTGKFAGVLGIALLEGAEVEQVGAPDGARMQSQGLEDARGHEGQIEARIGLPDPIGNQPRDVVEPGLRRLCPKTRRRQGRFVLIDPADGAEFIGFVVDGNVARAEVSGMSLDLDDLLAFDRLARDLDFADDVLDGKGRTKGHGGAGPVEGGGFGEAAVLAVGVDDVAVKIGQEHRRAVVE